MRNESSPCVCPVIPRPSTNVKRVLHLKFEWADSGSKCSILRISFRLPTLSLLFFLWISGCRHRSCWFNKFLSSTSAPWLRLFECVSVGVNGFLWVTVWVYRSLCIFAQFMLFLRSCHCLSVPSPFPFRFPISLPPPPHPTHRCRIQRIPSIPTRICICICSHSTAVDLSKYCFSFPKLHLNIFSQNSEWKKLQIFVCDAFFKVLFYYAIYLHFLRQLKIVGG